MVGWSNSDDGDNGASSKAPTHWDFCVVIYVQF